MCVVASGFLVPYPSEASRDHSGKRREAALVGNHPLYTADIAAPPEAVQSLQNIANRAETFFASWLTRWGYLPHRQKIFSRGENGCVLVRTVSGDRPLSSGAYDNWQSLAKNRLQVKICDATVGQYSIPRNGNYFWIFVCWGPIGDIRTGVVPAGRGTAVTVSSGIRTVATSRGRRRTFTNSAMPSACRTSDRGYRTRDTAA